jgi:hypothetical protein
MLVCRVAPQDRKGTCEVANGIGALTYLAFRRGWEEMMFDCLRPVCIDVRESVAMETMKASRLFLTRSSNRSQPQPMLL